eukprot:TRINITY_DN46504_c0_g1_i1.p1 TRINITY_DN46504_c0_g1~~TRINITY_DN46504_c0_g1_i1.p1  ORF type:complete len:202 (+),score=39.94 TRINITY_DN46504_c0_g1_i1:27-632(+)
MSVLAQLGVKRAVGAVGVVSRRRVAGAKVFPKGKGMQSSLGEDESLRVPVEVVAGDVGAGGEKLTALQKRMLSSKKEILMVTEDAAEVIKNLLKRKTDSPMGVRIGVEKKGCNGLAYTMEYLYPDYIETHPTYQSSQTTQHGVTIQVEPDAFMHVVGTVMDYHIDKASEKFVFLNPNSAGSCGCGKSFVSNQSPTETAASA